MFERCRLIFRRFSPVEERLLNESTKLLPDETAQKLRRQIESINKVQRLLDWTEISFYRIEGGKALLRDGDLFHRKDEVRIAAIRFVVGGKEFLAAVQAVCGSISSLVIRPSIRHACFGHPIEIKSAELVENPDLPVDESATAKPLPKSFLDWLAGNSSRTVDGWDISDESDAYRISLPSSDYFVLAIREGVDYLMAKADTADERIYIHSDGEGDAKLIAESFATALRADAQC